jgi:hypothetical protein
MSNTLFLIIDIVLLFFNVILTIINSKLKKECDLNAEYCKDRDSDCTNKLSDIQLEIHEANVRFIRMRELYLKALIREIKRYKQTAKEKVRKLTYRTKR